MKSEWKTIKLGDVCNIRSSKRIFAREYCSQGIPFYRGKEIIEKHKGNTVSTELFISAERYMEIMEKNDVPRVGDILLTSVGTLGVPWLVDEDRFYFKDGNLTWLRAKKELDNRYLYLWLCSPEAKNQIEMKCIGSTQKAITIETLNKFEMFIPNIEMQRKIVNLLFAIIKKIELNRKINDNLEQQAQEIFVNMFANNSSMTSATIADVALNVTDGVHNTIHDDPTGEYLLLSCKNIKGGSLSIGSNERTINKDTFDKLRRRTKLGKGDVLISSIGTVGELLLLNSEPHNYEFQRSVAIVKPNPQIVSSAYLFESLTYQRAELINAAHGAVQQCLFIADIASFPISIPNREELLYFNNIVNPMFDIITANESENKLLSEMRDSLLPKLMSGEIDVSNI